MVLPLVETDKVAGKEKNLVEKTNPSLLPVVKMKASVPFTWD